jgi:hypothetical protein
MTPLPIEGSKEGGGAVLRVGSEGGDGAAIKGGSRVTAIRSKKMMGHWSHIRANLSYIRVI